MAKRIKIGEMVTGYLTYGLHGQKKVRGRFVGFRSSSISPSSMRSLGLSGLTCLPSGRGLLESYRVPHGKPVIELPIITQTGTRKKVRATINTMRRTRR